MHYNNKYLRKVKKNEVEAIFLNGRGGGDFRGSNNYVGTWARDVISVESKKPQGFTEIKPNFAE